MKYVAFLFSCSLLLACGGGQQETPADVAARIRAMEDSVFEGLNFDKRRALALVDVYKAYANANPLDTMAPEYLFRAANVAKSLHEGEAGIALYDRIIKDYPGWGRLADVYYLKAFTIDSELGHKGEAEAAYREVIAKYPDHAFAKDAKAMIENLQYTDEQLIQRFQAMQDSADAAGASAVQ